MVAARKGMISKGRIAVRGSTKKSRYFPLKCDFGRLQNRNVRWCAVRNTYMGIPANATNFKNHEISHGNVQLYENRRT